MRIVQLLPELNTGGVERGAVDLSAELIKQGHKSYIISNGGLFEQEVINHGGKHIKLPIHKKSLSTLFLANKLYETYTKINPDIIHVRSRVPALVNLLAFRKFKQKRPLLISTFHGLYSKPFYSQVMAKVDHTIAISSCVKSYIQENYKIHDSNITLIHRGCDIKKFNNDPLESSWKSNFFNKFPNAINKKILVLPGRITRWKGAESFINLLERLDDSFHGLIVGPSAKNKEGYLKELKEKISKNRLNSKVTFTGGVSDIKNIYKLADIVYNLSTKPEPFGRTTIEAISCGAKVMGWDHGGTSEILNKLYKQGLVELNNDNDLFQKTIDISISNNYPEKNIYDSQKMLSDKINLYLSLLKTRS